MLIIGFIKDTAAAELTKTIVPILQNAHKINIVGTGPGERRLPNFNTDKQLLQISSVINGQFVKTPWRTFEFDSCFRTISPVADGNNNNTKNNQASVKGAFKNVISAERMFVKSYIQLWQSENDLTVRSHVFSYDRPCYPGLDIPGELLLPICRRSHLKWPTVNLINRLYTKKGLKISDQRWRIPGGRKGNAPANN